MTLPMILAPLFVLVLMTFVIGFILAGVRGPLLTRGEIRPEAVSLREPNWPPRALQVGYSFQNQFELPMLFYVLTILAIISKHADFLFVVMAWIFVLTRLAHAYVHCTSNDLRARGALFGIGALVLAIIWLIFMVRIMLGRLRVAARKRLADSVIACGLPHLGRGDLDLGLRELSAIQDKVAGLRRFGAAALDMAFVAAGRLDGYWERNISPWDIAAGIIILREAGGFVTDIDGADAMFTKKHVVAGNETIQRELQTLLKAAG